MDCPKLCLTGGPLDHFPNGWSKSTSHRWSIEPSSKWTIQNYISQVVHWTIVQMDNTKLCLTGGPLDHRPNGRSTFRSHRWSIGPLSIFFINLDGLYYAIWSKGPYLAVRIIVGDNSFKKNQNIKQNCTYYYSSFFSSLGIWFHGSA